MAVLTEEEKMEMIKYEGLKAVCKKYREVLEAENPDADWHGHLDWRLEYENMELSETLIGASVGIWLGALGDQRWSCFQWFSISASSEWENAS